MINKPFLLVLMLFSVLTSGKPHAQQIIGAVAGELKLSAAFNKQQATVSFTLEDFVGILADADTDLLEGLEVKIDIPRSISQHRNSFAIYIYKNISPNPSSSNQTYRGVQAYMRMLPVLDTCFIIIPFLDGNTFRQDAKTLVIPQSINKEEFPLILTIQPVAKALPSGIYDQRFKVTIKPLYASTGFFTLSFSNDTQDKLKDVFIDGKLWSGSYSSIPLPVGVHSIMILSTRGEKDVRNIMIEAGKTTTLRYSPNTVETATILFEIPEGMDVFIDGKPVVFESEQNMIKLPPGSHQIAYTSGDYKYTRTVELSTGEKLRVRLQVDLMIEKY